MKWINIHEKKPPVDKPILIKRIREGIIYENGEKKILINNYYAMCKFRICDYDPNIYEMMYAPDPHDRNHIQIWIGLNDPKNIIYWTEVDDNELG